MLRRKKPASPPLSKRTYRIYALVCCALIAYATLYPFKFDFSEHRFEKGLARAELIPLWSNQGHAGLLVDVVSNILLYMPLGAALWGLYRFRRRKSHREALLLVLASSASLSLATEVLQLFLPSRFCSINDLLFNALGGITGAVFFPYAHAIVSALRSRFFRHPHAHSGLLPAILLAVIQVILALSPFIPTVYPQQVWKKIAGWFSSTRFLLDPQRGLPSHQHLETFLLAAMITVIVFFHHRRDGRRWPSVKSMLCLLLFYPLLGTGQLFIQHAHPDSAFVFAGMLGVVFGSLTVVSYRFETGAALVSSRIYRRLLVGLYASFFVVHFFYPTVRPSLLVDALALSSTSWIPYDLSRVDISVSYVLCHFKSFCLAVPFGYFFACKTACRSRWRVLLLAGSSCLLLSFAIELLQLHLFSSPLNASDLMDCLLGGTSGAALYAFCEDGAKAIVFSSSIRTNSVVSPILQDSQKLLR